MSDTDKIHLVAWQRAPPVAEPLGDDHPEWSQEGRWPLRWCILAWLLVAPCAWLFFYVLWCGGREVLSWAGHGFAMVAHQADLFFLFGHF